jgi:C-terminal processing protease CtpA/Prc
MSLRIIALLASLLFVPFVAVAAVEATKADPEFSAREVRADFKALYAGLRDAHYDLYARRPRAEYDALYAQMRKDFNRPLHLTEVQQAFQRFAAFGRVAHARIDEAGSAYENFRAGGGKAMALRIRVVDGRSYVVANLSGNPDILVGDELVSVDGAPMSRLLAELGQHVAADNSYMLNTLMELRFPALLWQLRGTQQAFDVVIRKPDGKQKTQRVLARSREEAEAIGKQQPALLELDWNRREARMLDDGVAYLRPGPFYNSDEGATDPWDNTAFVQFIDASFKSFDAAGAKSLLIDLRDNPGGDNSFSDAMLAWFASKPFRFCSDFRIKVSTAATASNAKRLPQAPAGTMSHLLAAAYAAHAPGEKFSFALPLAEPRAGKRFGGAVFMLINRHSYSNTANVAALAQDYGFARIIGEETSDLATTYGAMEQFELPRTGIVVGFPKAHIIRISGDLQARGVVPDVAIAMPVVQSADDPVLKRALEILKM